MAIEFHEESNILLYVTDTNEIVIRVTFTCCLIYCSSTNVASHLRTYVLSFYASLDLLLSCKPL